MEVSDPHRAWIDALAARIARMPSVEAVWLYGSRARGDHRPRSDIDLAVSAPHGSERAWSDACALVEDADTLLPIDLVWLEKAGPELRAAVQSQGVKLYERRD